MKKIDAMGKVCPLPVIETKKALKTEEGRDGVEIMVDNLIATQNLSKMADQMKLSHAVEKISDTKFRVTVGAVGEKPVMVEAKLGAAAGGYVVAIGADVMGGGAEELGKKLIQGFIYALAEQDELPEKILFYNAGVYLTNKESASLEDLKALEAGGVEILSCGLCTNYYGITEGLGVGSITNMYRIVEILRSSHVVRP